MNYREALAWLFGTQRFGIKLGLENIQRLLTAFRLPGPEQRIIHVAGTNGKGSVCAMIDAVARAQGYRTALFTSPHLVTFRERCQVNGELIREEQVASGLTAIRELTREWDPHPTFFEIATALALDHFKRSACELIVLETGMGGRLDATNAVTPVASVITPIDYDHQKWLGNTLPEIAAEKAGIIKPGVPVISSPQPAEAEAVIRARAEELNAPLHVVTSAYEGELRLHGAHQRQNAAVALAALGAAQIPINDASIAAGLTSVSWPARFQQWDDRIVIDGGHNPAGVRVLAETWRETFGDERAAIILGILQDKDAASMIATLAPLALEFILPPVRSERAFSPAELREIVQRVAPDGAVTFARGLADALELAATAPRGARGTTPRPRPAAVRQSHPARG